MNKFLKVLLVVIVIAVIGFVAFLGFHYFASGGQLPLQLCSNCHTS
jgi:hypothetical protein